MKKISLLLTAIFLALIPLTAKADKLEFNSGGPIGPYNLTLNGTTTLLLFCLNDTDKISSGETWNVWVVAGNNLSNPIYGLTSTQITDYAEEAYIYSQLNPGVNNTAVQDALWKVFDSGDTVTGAALTLYDNALVDYSTVNLANYDFYIYSGGTPTGLTGDDTAAPQNFIGIAPLSTTPTPEPSTLVMLGTGLAGLAGVIRRKLARG